MNFIKKWLGKVKPYNSVKTPIILQQSETECGIAALASLFAYYQFNISLEELRDQCGASRDGCKALTLIKIARQYGFQTEAYSMDIEAVSLLEEPVIAFWGFSHFVVINGVGTDKVFINDPGQGSCAISMADFDKLFTGVIIRLIPTERVSKIKKPAIILPLLRQWVSSFYGEILYLLSCFLLVICWPLIYCALSNIFINYCVISGHLEWILYIIIGTGISSVIFLSAKIVLKWSEFKLAAKTSLLKCSRLMTHLLQIPLIYFSLRQKSEIIANVSRVEFVINAIYRSINSFLGNGLILLVCVISMIKINARLCLITCGLSTLSCIATIVISKINLNYEKSNVNNMGKLYANTLSWIKNLETIKACGLENSSMRKWHSLFVRKINVYDKIAYMNAVLNLFNKAVPLSSNLMIVSIGALDMTQGNTSIGSLMAYMALHLYYCSIISSVFQAIKDFMSVYAAHVRVNDIITQPVDSRFMNTNHKYPINHQTNNHIILCNDIVFYYNKTAFATLNKINLAIKAGEHIAIVGNTGSGKSTLAKILCSLYQPDSGSIVVYGKPITCYTSASLTQIFAYVSQDVSLFSGHLYGNLLLGKESVELSAVYAALKIACLEDLINVRGLYAEVAEAGSNFSGGEKQRIDIARALIQDTPILILDEATSALDVQTEAKLIKNLQTTNKTIIFIAHRLSTIQHCDQIIVMANGSIKETGRHDDLLKNKSNYYELVGCV